MRLDATSIKRAEGKNDVKLIFFFFPGKGKSRLLWTDVILSILIFVGLFIIFLLGLVENGGYRDLVDRARHLNFASNGREQVITFLDGGYFIYWDYLAGTSRRCKANVQ